MLHSPLLIPPSAAFWSEAACALLNSDSLREIGGGQRQDLSELRVLVPTFVHVRALQKALARELPNVFIPPRISTLSAWLQALPPDPAMPHATSDSERLMALYAELRQHAWLKKLFTARRNTELLPLAQTLLDLCDELTASFLPAIQLTPDTVERRWQVALEKLSPSARSILSDEAQLVWSIWKSQLDGSDGNVVRFRKMMQLAQRAFEPLVWVSPIEPDGFEQAFLDAYGKRQTVVPIMLDSRSAAIAPAYARAWHELSGDVAGAEAYATAQLATPRNLSLQAAHSLEQEAVQGAQTIIDWLQTGKSHIAIIAQDRVVARRMRALLERAQVCVSDETGWKLSTTRAAAAVAAWFDVVTARAETVALLDFLKSPFVLADLHATEPDKSAQVMAIELALRSANVLGGWNAAMAAVVQSPAARQTLSRIAKQAESCVGRRTLAEWCMATQRTLDVLGMRAALSDDIAGQQVLALLDVIARDGQKMMQPFSFPEWRAFVSLQLESTPFNPPQLDQRVVMMPLNGARLRSFDAVLMVGVDAAHLPSLANETLFFANAVRRELGLATRESRQRQQLRDFTEMLSFNDTVVLSWQSIKDGEPNSVSTWIERLQLVLERSGAEKISTHQVTIQSQNLQATMPTMPAPSASQLLPEKLSASGYNSFVACPYQFFATRMLGLSGLDELSDLPQKRDYGDWLHSILQRYHSTLRDHDIALDNREVLLREISENVFNEALEQNAAALGYCARWRKAMPLYLTWANQHEAQGWHFVIGEAWRERDLQWQDGEIRLHGRIDRIDQSDAGEYAVLDYKTNPVAILRDKLRQDEDHQLAFYGLLSDIPVSAAHYVALEATKDKTGDVAATAYGESKQTLEQQIARNLSAIKQGAALPANGIEAVCQYCAVRGLCRKGAW